MSGIQPYHNAARTSRNELAMWIDHFLAQVSIQHTRTIRNMTHYDLNLLLAVKLTSVEASIRRKLQKIKEKEENDLIKEAETFKLFM
jgi:adenine C2-methylase RlmN of 23S rRNA A2503 and tRNA A37